MKTNRSSFQFMLVVGACAGLSTAAANAAIVSINFASAGALNTGNGGATALTATETPDAPGGVVGNWNNLPGVPYESGGYVQNNASNSVTYNNLMDSSGSVLSGTSATVAANDTYSPNFSTTQTNNSTNPSSATNVGGADYTLFNGFLDDGNSGTITITVSGLTVAPSATYSVYLYTATDGGQRYAQYSLTSGSYNTTYYGSVSGFGGSYTQITNTTVDNSSNVGSLTGLSGNYEVFSGLVGSSFTITAAPDVISGSFPRAPINGLQIVGVSAVPEPASLGLCAVGAMGLLLLRRRKMT